MNLSLQRTLLYPALLCCVQPMPSLRAQRSSGHSQRSLNLGLAVGSYLPPTPLASSYRLLRLTKRVWGIYRTKNIGARFLFH